MNMISEHHNYDDGYIALVNLTIPGLPKTIEVAGYKLLLKSEFHISLICAKKVAPLINPFKAEPIEAEIVKHFLEFIETTPLTGYSLTKEFRLVKKDERVTLIVMANVPGLEQFFETLEEKYGAKLPLQPTHITLYTLQPEAGIGILTDEELHSNSQPVKVPLELSPTHFS